MRLLLVIIAFLLATVNMMAQPVQQSNTPKQPVTVLYPKKDTCINNQVVQGEWQRTKGAQLYISGILIDPSELEKLPNRRKFANDRWRGKNVTLKGKLCTHYCTPYEQCLEGGVMQFLSDIEYIKKAKRKR